MKYEFNISLNFIAISFLFLFSGFVLWNYNDAALIWAFIFVISGWIVSLCLHEFGHAFAAFYFGDFSVAEKGYLTLNPLKYSNVFMSVVLPVIFLMAGGIGFPGGAVYINMAAIKTNKQQSIISAAGPLATAVFACLLLSSFLLNIPDLEINRIFWASVSFLTFLQISALFLNLLPVPGLDGFGIFEPFLKSDLKLKIRKMSGIAILVVFFLLFSDTFVNRAFWSSIAYVAHLAGLDFDLVREGYQVFTFWN